MFVVPSRRVRRCCKSPVLSATSSMLNGARAASTSGTCLRLEVDLQGIRVRQEQVFEEGGWMREKKEEVQ